MTESAELSSEQEAVLELLRKYGRNVYSFEVLEPGLSYWFNASADAVVAYVEQGWHWVAAGGPICPRENLTAIILEFAAAAKAHKRKAAFFGVSDRFVSALPEASSFDWLQIGEQPLWDPRRWSESWEKSRKVRNRVSRAVREGIEVREVTAKDLASGSSLRADTEELINRWVSGHPMPPMRFMVTLELFSHHEERRYFLSEQNGKVVGLLVAVPIYGQKGWLLEDMIIERGSASGTAESLIDLAMRSFGKENYSLASTGLVALAGVTKAKHARHPYLSFFLNWCYRSLNWLYSFQGLYAFRSKFHPTVWEPVYLVCEGRLNWLTVRAVLMAFAGGWVPFFAFRTAGRWIKLRKNRSQEAPKS